MDEGKKTMTITIDQHEAITNMKHGRDTYYDVVDRLLENTKRIDDLERQMDSFRDVLLILNNTVHDLKKEMMKCIQS